MAGCQVKLLGPDLDNPLILAVEPSDTIVGLKEKALANWPGTGDRPLVGQLKILHMGRFVNDTATLKECKVTEGETTAMHVIVKSQVAKPAETPSSSDDKAPKCGCVVC